MNDHPKVQKIAFVGDHLPRKCGIATFTSDLLSSVATAYPSSECIAVSVNDVPGGYPYPEVVRFEIEEQDLSSYLRAARALNLGNFDVVCLQHEFGIFGGPAGSHVLAMLRELRMPVVTTMHTILQHPREDQRSVVHDLISLSSRLVVMTERGRRMLLDLYDVPADRIDLIAHGIPDVRFVDPACFKPQFDVAGKTVILTFGLLSPGKGIEHVINALPSILANHPDIVYIVLGATHPNELREHGEAYRLGLELLARTRGVGDHVHFYNQFVELETLTEFIGAADLYVTPYLNEAQITSGTLAYAFGAGKAVVSTPYWHAAELLAEERGVLVPFGDSRSIAREITSILHDRPRLDSMRKQAYRIGRGMVWSNVARRYMDSFLIARAQAEASQRRPRSPETLGRPARELPNINLDHLAAMTDSTGVFQHAVFSVPNFSEGYCTDDNARAFVLAALLGELGVDSGFTRTLRTTCAAFLHHAFDFSTARFHNHLSFSRNWLDSPGSEDCHGRAVWALGTGAGRDPRQSTHLLTGHLFALALPPVARFSSPRAWAFSLLGIHEYLRRRSGDPPVHQAREMLASRLSGLFDQCSSPSWLWFEDELSYDNAKLAHALIVSGSDTGQPALLHRGLQALRWLVELQRSGAGHFRPVGSEGFYPRGGVRAMFDQQPIEAQATVSACLEAFRVTSDLSWYEHAGRAFDWYHGSNDLGLALYSSLNGGCGDGLHPDRVNANQGAESTLACLLSVAEMRLACSLPESPPLQLAARAL
jgi:glycosyltransferase involved in cell wall biosynthesis